MTQEERLDYLVKAFCEDSVRYRGLKVRKEERRTILRSLMNIRMPGAIAPEILQAQDEFLRQEAIGKGIVAPEEIPSIGEAYGSHHPFADRISVWQGDITRLSADAIVNAANARMLGCFIPCHGCIDNAVHSAAGLELRQACDAYMAEKRIRYGADYEEPTGTAVLTPGFNLPCKCVLHTVGPIAGGELTDGLVRELRSCYRSCLELAAENHLRSVAFCCISTGEFRFPNRRAAEIAVCAVTDFLRETPDGVERIIFNVFKDQDLAIYEELLSCGRT